MILKELLENICKHIPDKTLYSRLVSSSSMQLQSNRLKVLSHNQFSIEPLLTTELPEITYMLFLYGTNTYNNKNGTNAWVLTTFNLLDDLVSYINNLITYTAYNTTDNQPYFLPIINLEPQPITISTDNNIIWTNIKPYKTLTNGKALEYSDLETLKGMLTTSSQKITVYETIQNVEIPYYITKIYDSITKLEQIRVEFLNF